MNESIYRIINIAGPLNFVKIINEHNSKCLTGENGLITLQKCDPTKQQIFKITESIYNQNANYVTTPFKPGFWSRFRNKIRISSNKKDADKILFMEVGTDIYNIKLKNSKKYLIKKGNKLVLSSAADYSWFIRFFDNKLSIRDKEELYRITFDPITDGLKLANCDPTDTNQTIIQGKTTWELSTMFINANDIKRARNRKLIKDVYLNKRNMDDDSNSEDDDSEIKNVENIVEQAEEMAEEEKTTKENDLKDENGVNVITGMRNIDEVYHLANDIETKDEMIMEAKNLVRKKRDSLKRLNNNDKNSLLGNNRRRMNRSQNNRN
ncbi:hypothetical protein HERIO_1944 [Hepatospora eriocheir]|uniref:Uncharacterized protein n=1 Tax=Hepatospora eriocheir TaxID=1081669 RepID=A0A1X0Q8S0_9MICR|nr:hypothetical protein HERIO_1944 [Hepatospora eriocheir]